MAFAAPPGVQSLPKGQAQNLRGNLAAVSGPANPHTPDDRTDPRERMLLDLQRIRRALERAMEEGEDNDPIQQIHKAAHGLYERLLSGVDPMVALQTASASLAPLMRPPTPPAQAPGAGMGAVPPPGGPPAGPGVSAPPPAMPGGGVSPGPLSPGQGPLG